MNKKLLVLFIIFSLLLNACSEKDKLIELNAKIDQLGNHPDAEFLDTVISNINYFDNLLLEEKKVPRKELSTEGTSLLGREDFRLIMFWIPVLDLDYLQTQKDRLEGKLDEKEYKEKMKEIIAEYKKDKEEYLPIIEEYVDSILVS